jgi:hypothetical protein
MRCASVMSAMVASWFRLAETNLTQRVRRSPWRPVVAATAGAVLLVGCTSTPDPAEVYCETVERTADAMAGTDVETKRPAMFELRDAAPAEIRDDWDVIVASSTDVELAERQVARGNVAEFEATHC